MHRHCPRFVGSGRVGCRFCSHLRVGKNMSFNEFLTFLPATNSSFTHPRAILWLLSLSGPYRSDLQRSISSRIKDAASSSSKGAPTNSVFYANEPRSRFRDEIRRSAALSLGGCETPWQMRMLSIVTRSDGCIPHRLTGLAIDQAKCRRPIEPLCPKRTVGQLRWVIRTGGWRRHATLPTGYLPPTVAPLLI